MSSWSPEDHLRHWAYEDIAEAVRRTALKPGPLQVLDFGSMWYGDEDGGWRTHVRTILKTLLGKERIVHTLAVYPQYNIESLSQVKDEQFDILVADQVLEHVERPWLAAKTVARVVAPGGLCIISTPGLYPIHPSPLDCWRIMPDGYKVLFPEVLWNYITLDAWGSAERVGYEYWFNGAFPYGPPTTAVEKARLQPHFNDKFDNRCPLILWFVGRRTVVSEKGIVL